MGGSLDEILEQLPKFLEESRQLRDVLLANLVMVSEIPSPTFAEEARVRFLQDRFSGSGLQNCSTDEVGNAFGVMPGANPERHLLVVAHADTVEADTVDHTVTVHPDFMRGPGIADNSLGVAVLATLPDLLARLDLSFDANLILMGATRSLGRGNLEGLRFFLSNKERPIESGLSIEGIQLGRLSYTSMGMVRGDIICEVPEEYDWNRLGAAGAITVMNEVISRMLEIELPRRPGSSIVFGKLAGGQSYGSVPTQATLGFEVRSESGAIVAKVSKRIADIVAELSAARRVDVRLDVFASREPGGIEYAHPLCKATRDIMERLGLTPRISPSVSELAAFIDAGIPAVTLGITNGERLHEDDESVNIEPMYTGIAQLLGVLLAMDRGVQDGD